MKRTWKITEAKNKQFKLNVMASRGGKSVATFGENLTSHKHAVDMAMSLSKSKEMQAIRNTLEQLKYTIAKDASVNEILDRLEKAIKQIDKSLDKVVPAQGHERQTK